MITDEDIAQTLERIGGTDDGRLFYLYLQRQLIGIPGGAEPSDSALRADYGRRRFAHELMGLLSKGIEGGQRTDASTERPIIFAVKQPVRVAAGQRSARDHIRDHDPELAALRVDTDAP